MTMSIFPIKYVAFIFSEKASIAIIYNSKFVFVNIILKTLLSTSRNK